jgi:hypothetical protein
MANAAREFFSRLDVFIVCLIGPFFSQPSDDALYIKFLGSKRHVNNQLLLNV